MLFSNAVFSLLLASLAQAAVFKPTVVKRAAQQCTHTYSSYLPPTTIDPTPNTEGRICGQQGSIKGGPGVHPYSITTLPFETCKNNCISDPTNCNSFSWNEKDQTCQLNHDVVEGDSGFDRVTAKEQPTGLFWYNHFCFTDVCLSVQDDVKIVQKSVNLQTSTVTKTATSTIYCSQTTSAIVPTPTAHTCGDSGSYTPTNSADLIQKKTNVGSFSECRSSCYKNANCGAFAFEQNNPPKTPSRCALYKKFDPAGFKEDILFGTNNTPNFLYEKVCFSTDCIYPNVVSSTTTVATQVTVFATETATALGGPSPV